MKHNRAATWARCALAMLAASQALAQVEHKKDWHPVRTVTAMAPPPTRLAERVREFEERDSPAAVERLARDIFGLLSPDYRPGDAALAEVYADAFARFGSQDYLGALERYRDFLFARMKANNAQGQDPAKRIFIEYYNEADLLMQDEILFAAFDKPMPREVQLGGTDAILNYYKAGKHNAHMINVHMTNGAPGRINWVYQPDFITGPTVHLPTGPEFLPNAYNADMFFTSLLAAYAQTGEARYLLKWAAIMDDFHLNHRRDLAEAGVPLQVGWGGAGGPSLGHLTYCLQRVPGAETLMPVTTYMRMLWSGWISSLPLQIRGTRVGGPNRIMHMYGFQLVQAYLASPELKEAGYLLRERRRCLEWYARSCVNPDGTGIDYAPNYNKNYLIWPGTDMAIYEKFTPPPAWLTPAWRAELAENQSTMARYLMRYFSPSGGMPGFKNPDRDMRSEYYGPTSLLLRVLPSVMEEPESQRLAAVLTPPNRKTGAARPVPAGMGPPSFTSESYPYGGYYFLRESWTRDAQFVYFNSYRPGSSGNWRHNQNLALEAFGQSMLNFYRWESPLLVDGAGQVYVAHASAYPARYREDPDAVLYGRYGSHMAWLEPIKSRWHTSAAYDLAEGAVHMPYTATFVDKPPVFIHDVKHHRQVVFARRAGVWVVTDRIRGESPHDYRLMWGFKPDRAIPAGWVAKKNPPAGGGEETPVKAEAPADPTGYAKAQIVVDAAAGTIKTANPAVPNLSIYHAATTDLTLTPGDIAQDTDKFGNTYRLGPQFRSGEAVLVASLLHPRRTLASDLKSCTPVRAGAVAGFDAVTESGAVLAYRAAVSTADLQAAAVTASASVLLVERAGAGALTGVALDCTAFAAGGQASAPPSADFEYDVDAHGKVSFTPIYRPMDMVEILPAADVFIDSVDVTLQHHEPDTEIRYTLDGTQPTLASARYEGPITLRATTWIKARAFRKGATRIPNTQDSTLASVMQTALYTKAPVMAAQPAAAGGALRPGLAFAYFEDDWTISALKLPILTPLTTGVAKDLADIAARRQNPNSYAFVYEGWMEIPATGVYTVHAPEEFVSSVANCGYDLRLFLDGVEWYPATRRHNFGNWCVPLEAGRHALRVVYVDQRRGDLQASKQGDSAERVWKGDVPRLCISGPGMERAAIPAAWLSHAD